jgi:hypothetical protein
MRKELVGGLGRVPNASVIQQKQKLRHERRRALEAEQRARLEQQEHHQAGKPLASALRRFKKGVE